MSSTLKTKIRRLSEPERDFLFLTPFVFAAIAIWIGALFSVIR